MSAAHGFDVTIVERSHHLRVTGSAAPYRPATGPTMEHAGGDPAEGGELEDVKIFYVYTRVSGYKTQRELADPKGELLAAIQDKITDKLAQEAHDDRGE